MADWYVHREQGVIVAAYQELRRGYAEEAVDEDAPELLAMRNPVPATASSGNFIRALHELEWIGAVKVAVAQVDGLAEDLWLHAAEFERRHPMVLQIAQAIGKTSDDLDELFRLSASYDP